MGADLFLDYDYSVGRDWHDYLHPYVGEYGNGSRHRNRFWPAIDQTDWNDAGLVPFSQFFTLPNNGRYYDVCYGPVHLFFLDSAPSEPDGKTSTSKQARWLQLKLMLSTARWKVVVLASPPFSSDLSQDSDLQWPFDEWGADIVLSGEAYDYERFSNNRFPYIVNGLGGKNLNLPSGQTANSLVLYAGNYGAGRVSVNKDTFRYEFYAIDGTLVDTFEITKGTSTMKPPIPSPSVIGAASQIVHGPWVNPNGNTFPADTGSAAIYYQDGVTPAVEWAWSITNQNWILVGSLAGNSDMVYVSNPNTEGLIPGNPQLPCTAYSQDGSGSFYGWNVSSQTWK